MAPSCGTSSNRCRASTWSSVSSAGLRPACGQNSEFSLLIVYLAAGLGLIGKEASHLVQATAILTFVVSSYIIVLRLPNPIAISERLRRD